MRSLTNVSTAGTIKAETSSFVLGNALTNLRGIEMVRNAIIHRNAICFDCKWTDTDMIYALERARRHYKKTGHHISVEVAYTVSFGESK